MVLIGIAGGTGSGKTTLAEMLIEKLGNDKVLLLTTDHYYKDLSHLPVEERDKVNFDDPNAIEWELFRADLKKLLNGEKVEAPVYDFKTHTRTGKQVFEPKQIIILEGIFALCDKELNDIMKLRVFVETPSDIRLMRRLKRDIKERGRTADSVLEQWGESVRDSHEAFIQPTSMSAHIIIPEDPDANMRETAVKMLYGALKELHVL